MWGFEILGLMGFGVGKYLIYRDRDEERLLGVKCMSDTSIIVMTYEY